MKKNKTTILDVRTPIEFADGHVSGARNIPVAEFKDRIAEIRALPKPLILCSTLGARSARAAMVLRRNHIPFIDAGSWRDVDMFFQINH